MSPAHLLARAGAAAMQGARRSRLSAGPPVISGTVLIGETLTSTAAGQWYRDGVAISGETGSSYVVVAADIGPAITCNGSNELRYDDAAHLPEMAIGVSTAGLTLADSDTTVDSWAASLGGIACTLAAPAATNRPAYSATGGTGSRPLVTGDGVDNVLRGTLTKGSNFATIELGVVGDLVTAGALFDRYIDYTFGSAYASIYERTGFARFQVNGGGGASSDTTTNPATSSPQHMSGDWDGSNTRVRITGTVEDTDACTASARSDGGTLSIFALSGGTSASNFAMQAWYCGPSLTADQRTHLRALLTFHTGIAC